MKLLNFDRVLCLAPHPDDAEYSMAGVVLKYPDTHFDILCLTEGGYVDITTNESRHIEVRSAWSVSNSTNYSLFFSDVPFFRSRGIDEWLKYIEDTFTNVNEYQCIMVPSEFDSHQEHTVISTLAAPLARVKPYSIIQYKSPSTLDSWVPNLFISLTDEQYSIKKKMICEFKSQLHKPYFSSEVIDGFHMNFQGLKKGKRYIEPYKIITYYE
jgi:LmbE family N-acetylglucosaminyl deacetylase